jgi:hypothetical protein
MWKNVGESLLSTNTVIVLRSYTDYHGHTGIKPDFSYEKRWYNLYYKHGCSVCRKTLDFQSYTYLPNRQLMCLSSSHPDKQRHWGVPQWPQHASCNCEPAFLLLVPITSQGIIAAPSTRCACNDWQFYDPHPLIADVIISSFMTGVNLWWPFLCRLLHRESSLLPLQVK